MSRDSFPENIEKSLDFELAKPTRIHPLISRTDGNLWIKREDELSGAIAGSKLRKYASLIPILKSKKIKQVGIIGGSSSNNVIGLIQMLRECSIKPIVFIREAGNPKLQGNSLFLSMLTLEDEVQSIPRQDWEKVEAIAKEYMDLNFPKDLNWVLKEGCFGAESLLGALTLASDVIRNQRESNLEFGRIYIDCGSGLSAIALILGLEYLLDRSLKSPEVVITLIAERESKFLEKLETMRILMRNYNFNPPAHLGFRFLKPTISPKFGSCNQSLLNACCQIAKKEGLLMDPVYSVKHFMTMQQDLKDSTLTKPALFIFNGSALGLAGFQDSLVEVV